MPDSKSPLAHLHQGYCAFQNSSQVLANGAHRELPRLVIPFFITTKTKGSNSDFLQSPLQSHYQHLCEEEDFSVSDEEPGARRVCKGLRLARGW